MNNTQLTFFIIIFFLWFLFYFVMVILQDVRKLDNDAIKKYAELSFQFLFFHVGVYWLLSMLIAELFVYSHWGEFWTLGTSVIFALILYQGEEIGINNMNRSLHNQLPPREVYVDNSVVYRKRWQI